MDEQKIQMLRHMQADHKIEAQRMRDILDMDDGNLMMMVDLYNAGELSPESAIAMEAIEAMEG